MPSRIRSAIAPDCNNVREMEIPTIFFPIGLEPQQSLKTDARHPTASPKWGLGLYPFARRQELALIAHSLNKIFPRSGNSAAMGIEDAPPAGHSRDHCPCAG